MTPMKVHASVFKAYDIRGIVGQTIDERFALHLGRAFGSQARAEGEKAVMTIPAIITDEMKCGR